MCVSLSVVKFLSLSVCVCLALRSVCLLDLNKYFTIEDKQQQKKKKKEKKSKLIYPDIDSSQRLGNRVWANKVKIKRYKLPPII